jgi:hypothetical protein
VSESASPEKRDLEVELDRLETMLAELKVRYEQYFLDILPRKPDDLNEQVIKFIRKLQGAPFKNSASRFRLKTLGARYQTYATYWERVNKQREDGTYRRDLFRAQLRVDGDFPRVLDKTKSGEGSSNQVEQRAKRLYDAYLEARSKVGDNSKELSFTVFKTSLVNRARQVSEAKGSSDLKYQVVVKEGKVGIKISEKD